jgi:hypothetical protein
MGATTVAAFDTKPRYLGEIRTFKAGEAIVAGSLVSFAASGVSDTVHPSTSSLGSVAGIALHSQATTGDYVAVAGNNSELLVMLEATDTAPEAGDWLTVSTVAGAAAIADMAVWAHNAEGAGLFPIGQAQEAATAGSGTTGATVYVLLNMTPPWTLQS